MTLFSFIIASLAVWRLSYAIVHENGPLMVFLRLRAHLARTQKRSGGLFDMVSCVRCLSMWIGLVGALFVSDSILALFVYAFAFSGAAALIDKLYSFSVVARPTTDSQIRVGRGSAPKEGNNMIGHPRSIDGSVAVKTFSTLDN